MMMATCHPSASVEVKINSVIIWQRTQLEMPMTLKVGGGNDEDEEDEDDDGAIRDNLAGRRRNTRRRRNNNDDDDEYVPPNYRGSRRRMDDVDVYGERPGERRSPRQLEQAANALLSWEERRNVHQYSLEVGTIIQYRPQTVGNLRPPPSHVVVTSIQYFADNDEPEIRTYPLSYLLDDEFAFRIVNHDNTYDDWRHSTRVNLRSGNLPVQNLSPEMRDSLRNLNQNRNDQQHGIEIAAFYAAMGQVIQNIRNEGRGEEREES